MIKLYRAISQEEKDDYDIDQLFRTGRNTLEAKQFFNSRTAVTQYIEQSILQDYMPPYTYLLTINIEENCLDTSNPTYMVLDSFHAVSISDMDLLTFSNCVIFVKQELL